MLERKGKERHPALSAPCLPLPTAGRQTDLLFATPSNRCSHKKGPTRAPSVDIDVPLPGLLGFAKHFRAVSPTQSARAPVQRRAHAGVDAFRMAVFSASPRWFSRHCRRTSLPPTARGISGVLCLKSPTRPTPSL